MANESKLAEAGLDTKVESGRFNRGSQEAHCNRLRFAFVSNIIAFSYGAFSSLLFWSDDKIDFFRVGTRYSKLLWLCLWECKTSQAAFIVIVFNGITFVYTILILIAKMIKMNVYQVMFYITAFHLCYIVLCTVSGFPVSRLEYDSIWSRYTNHAKTAHKITLRILAIIVFYYLD